MASPMAADRDDGDAGQRATRWVGRSVPRVEDAALLTGRGPLHRRSRHAPRHLAGRDPALAARACGHRSHRLPGGARGGRRRRGAHRRRRHGADLEPRGRREGAARLLADRGRSRALRRRAGRDRRRFRPLPRRRRPRPDRGALSPVAGGRRSGRRRRAGCAAPASARAKQRRRRARVPLRRSRARVRRGRAPRPRRRALSAQFLHADRDLWRRRRIRRGGGRLRRPRQLPGAVQPAPGHGAGAEGPRQPLAAAHAAGFRRQLRRQAGDLSLHRADRGRGARRPGGR